MLTDEDAERSACAAPFSPFEVPPHTVVRFGHRASRTEALTVFGSEFVAHNEGILDKRQQQRKIDLLVHRNIVNVNRTRLPHDRSEQRRSWNRPNASLVGVLHSLRTLQRLRPAGHLQRVLGGVVVRSVRSPSPSGASTSIDAAPRR